MRDPAEVLVFLNKLADLAEKGVTKSLCTSVASGVRMHRESGGEGGNGSDSSDVLADTTQGRGGEAA